MKRYSLLWKRLERVQQVCQTNRLDLQDEAIMALQNYIKERPGDLYPSFVYPLLIHPLDYYCRCVLPQRGLPVMIREVLCEEAHQLLTLLHQHKTKAERLEDAFKHVIFRVYSGAFDSVTDIAAALYHSVSGPPDDPHILEAIRQHKSLRQYVRTVQHNQVLVKHVRKFFDTLLDALHCEPFRSHFAAFQPLFWNQVDEVLGMKAVVVDSLDHRAKIIPLEIESVLKSSGEDCLEFFGNVDERMQQSCRDALHVVRTYLETHFPTSIQQKTIHVRCRFQNPVATYTDASISLLVGVKVLGEILELPIHPHVVITGELDDTGRVLPVGFLPQKRIAAAAHPDIHQFYFPDAGEPVNSPPIASIRVRTFSETVEHYYGPPLQQKRKKMFLSRRGFLHAAALGGVAAAFSGLTVLTKNSAESLSEQDEWLVEYAQELYQKQADHEKALRILHSILNKFEKSSSSINVLQLKARIFMDLGRIYRQRYRTQESLSAYNRSLECWKAINDRENQADILLRIGDVYRYTVAVEGVLNNSVVGLKYYELARDLIKPSMKMFNRLQGSYYSWSGYMYYWLHEYEKAEQYSRKGVALLDEAEMNWKYQMSRQYLGRVLIRTGKCDEAFEILDKTTHTSALQNPTEQCRSYWSFSDLFLSIEKFEEGLEFAMKSNQLCQEFDLKLQQLYLQKVLRRHNYSLSDVC